MNNNGSVFFYTLMLGILVLVVALALAGPVREFVDSTRNESTSILMSDQTASQPGLNCTSDTLSNFDRSACIISDLSLFYFIGGLIFVAGAIITARLIFS